MTYNMRYIFLFVMIVSIIFNVLSFQQPQDSVSIEWISEPEIVNPILQAETERMGYKYHHVSGIADITYLSDNRCTIWALEPEDQYDEERMRTLGHEFLHCFKGQFHEVFYE